MAEQKKILVSLEKTFLEEMDAYIKSSQMTRSAFVRTALRFYMQEKRREAVRLMMEEGYREMGEINKELACFALEADNETIFRYEENLR
ncbi:MAG: CopG family transcriptional regulator [Clostridia bacterium]|nr:CopG family transcriptional regulator [Clostridia bacterium]